MSYQHLQTGEGEDVGDHEDASLTPNRAPLKQWDLPARRFFKTSTSLHTAISVAAGTVMALFGYAHRVAFKLSVCWKY
jgi:hypothetical protein